MVLCPPEQHECARASILTLQTMQLTKEVASQSHGRLGDTRERAAAHLCLLQPPPPPPLHHLSTPPSAPPSNFKI